MYDARARDGSDKAADHPLVGVERSIERVRRQAHMCAAIAAGSAAIAWYDVRAGLAVAGAAATVAVVLRAAAGILGTSRRACVHDVILRGEVVDSSVFADEVRRLRSHRHRDRLASVLERALADGRRWDELMPASRPPPGARHLPDNEAAIRAIATGLRRDDASLRAVVLVDRLVRGGYGSSLYEAHADWLRRELGRIRFDVDATGRD